MAKSPSKASSKFLPSSGRLSKRAEFTRHSLKSSHFQLPVPLARHSRCGQDPNWKEIKFEYQTRRTDKKCFRMHVLDKKKRLKRKYFESQTKEADFEQNPDSKILLKQPNCSSKKATRKKPVKQKIGIFERTQLVFPQNRKYSQEKLECKKEPFEENKEIQPKFGECAKNEFNMQNESNSIKIESARKTSPKIKPANENQLECENTNYEIGQKTKSLPKKIGNTKENQNQRKTSLNQNFSAIKGFPASKETNTNKTMKPEFDNLTVNTCNTIREMSQLQIEDEASQHKCRLVKLSKLQKYFVAYNGNFCLKFQKI